MKTVGHSFNQGFSNELVYNEKLRSALSTPVFVSEPETAMTESSQNDGIEFNDVEYES